jgi:hypothetical protein
LRFARESRQSSGIERRTARHYLEGDVAIQLRVSRAVHLAHGARAEERDDVVGTQAKTSRECGAGGGHSGALAPSCEELGKLAAPVRAGKLFEQTAVGSVRRQQRLDLAEQRPVAACLSLQEGMALAGWMVEGGLKQRLHTWPSLVDHG